MAISVNKVTIVGRVGSDPVTRETSKGDPVCNLSIATNNGYGDNQTTDWHRVTFFGKLASVVSEYVKQGQELFVDGRITYRKYTDSNGVEKTSTDIIANQMQMGAKGKDQVTIGTSTSSTSVDEVPF